VLRAARAAGADAVYWNDEYEPALIERDRAVERALREAGIGVRRFHDRLLVPPGAVATREGRPFVVFTPFERACRELPPAAPLPPVTRLATHGLPGRPIATLEQLGFGVGAGVAPWPGGERAAARRLRDFLDRVGDYAARRDVPAAESTSRLSADLKFGTVSARRIAAAAHDAAAADLRVAPSAAKLVSELRWRDFYAHVLFHFPHCERGAFRREYDGLKWPGDHAHFQAWRDGRTGYPIVDAGMRQLAATGWMHNRVRMIVASFLAKDLLLDWRLGERHFMRHLVDGDLASNNGGWQWAASTGTDAAPYFRVFNPTLQGQRYDPDGEYVRRWVPELRRLDPRWVHRPWEAPGRPNYPEPIVDHALRRQEAIALYAETAKAKSRIDI
jgi:deoxyribodipyrimidine photo-lyase